MFNASSISIKKVDFPSKSLSEHPKRVKIRSKTENLRNEQQA